MMNDGNWIGVGYDSLPKMGCGQPHDNLPYHLGMIFTYIFTIYGDDLGMIYFFGFTT